MRLARPLALLMVLTAVLAACAAESTPGWTFSPTPTPTVAPSSEPGASSAPGDATPAPSGAPTAAPSDGGTGGAVVQVTLTASGIAFDTDSLEVPADTPFQIVFANNDAGIPHNVAIHEGSPTGSGGLDRARSSTGSRPGPTTCRPSRPGPTASSARSTPT